MTSPDRFTPTKTVFYFRTLDRWAQGGVEVKGLDYALETTPTYLPPETYAVFVELQTAHAPRRRGRRAARADRQVRQRPPVQTEDSPGDGLFVFERNGDHVHFKLTPVLDEEPDPDDGSWLELRSSDRPPGAFHTVIVPAAPC